MLYKDVILPCFLYRYLKYLRKTYEIKRTEVHACWPFSLVRKTEYNENYKRDFQLSPLEDHFMFWEYLQVGK